MKNKPSTNKETVEIPIYSNIRMVNGKIIAAVNGTIETPIEWLKEGGIDGQGASEKKR